MTIAAPAGVLVVNAGSSSLKLSLLDDTDQVRLDRTAQRWDGEEDLEPLERFLAAAGEVAAVGHRVVHGGPRYRTAVVLDPDVVDDLASLADLAPLHQPRSVAGIRAVRRLLPDTPAVACFDTAFHAGMPPEAATYALPREWNERFGLRRFGFHGLSHAYATRRAGELLGRPIEELRLVTCHLGAGASLAAVRGGRSVDTTMGFTPLAGLVMATRSGSVDPGLLLWLLRRGGLSVEELEGALERRSGLAGLTGTSGDLRDVLAGRDAGDATAALALRIYNHRLAREAAAMTAAIGGLDALVLTGGVGENSAEVRADLARRLTFLGVCVDEAVNASARPDADVSCADAAVRMLVVAAREDLEVARQTRAALR